MPVDLDQKDGVTVVQDAIEEAERYIRPRIGRAVEAVRAYESRLSTLSSDDAEVAVNHLKPMIKRFAAQNQQAMDPDRPWIKLTSLLTEERHKAKIYADAIDSALQDAGYIDMTNSLWYGALGHGNAFSHVGWESWEVRTKSRRPDFNEFGQFAGMAEEMGKRRDSNLLIEYVPFWQMGFPRAGNTLKTKDWCFRWSIKSITDIERMIDIGRFPSLPKNFDRATLRMREGTSKLSALQHMNKFLSMGDYSGDEEGVGVLIEFFSRNRWIVCWNGLIDMDPKNQEPRLYNVDTRVKPFAQLKLPSGIGGDQFWGESLWDQIRDKEHLANMLAALHLRHLYKDANRMTFVDSRVLDGQTVAEAEYGDIIEYDGQALQGGEPVHIVDFGQPDKSLIDFESWCRERIEDIGNEPPIARGESPSPRQTAHGMGILQQNLAPVQSAITRFAEGTYKTQFAELVTAIYSCEAQYTQMGRRVGMERAEMVMTPDVYSGLYGGHSFEMEGADRVGAKAARAERFLQFYNFGKAYFDGLAMAGDPSAMQRNESLFQAWEQYIDGIPDAQREVIFGDVTADPQVPATPVQPQIAQNQIPTPIANREMQNQPEGM